MPEYEYGVMQRGREGLHRGPMTEWQARGWVKNWQTDTLPGAENTRDLFFVARRRVGKWEQCPS